MGKAPKRDLSQKPFFNVLKNNPIRNWKRQGIGPNPHFVKDEDLNCSVLVLDGTVTASNALILPCNKEEVLSLTGRFIYFVIRTNEGRGFMIHIDSKTIDGLDFRISVSNIFSQVKTTNLSLHLPYVNPAVGAKQQSFILKKGTDLDIRDSMTTENLEHSNWTLLRLDMPNLISMHSRHKHRHINRIQLCSNLRIAGVFTSDLEYSPLINRSTRPQLANKGVKEFPLPQDVLPNASDIPLPIDIIKLPDVLPTELGDSSANEQRKPRCDISALRCRETSDASNCLGLQLPEQLLVHTSGETTKEGRTSNGDMKTENSKAKYLIEDPRNLRHELIPTEMSPRSNDGSLSHISSEDETTLEAEHERGPMNDYEKTESKRSECTSAVPNLSLCHIAGCSNHCSEAIISPDGKVVIFSSGAVIIFMEIESRLQHHLTGHTNTIKSICMNSDRCVIASSQESAEDEVGLTHLWRLPDPNPALRVHYPFATGRAKGIRSLNGVALSRNAELLVTYGEDVQGRGIVIVWDARWTQLSSVLPLLCRSFVEFGISRLVMLPSMNEGEVKEDEKFQLVRFFTLPDQTGTTLVRKKQVDPKDTSSLAVLRLWRLRVRVLTGPKTPGVSRSTDGQLSSSPVHLSSVLPSTISQGLRLIDCCVKPALSMQRTTVEETKMEAPLTHSVLICCSGGYLFEFSPNLLAVVKIYRVAYSVLGSSGERTLKVQLIGQRREGELKLIDCDKENTTPVLFTRMNWIHLGPGPMDGWVATGSEDGCLRLWNGQNLSEPLKLEVTYPAAICAVSSCTLGPQPVMVASDRRNSDEHNWSSVARIVLGTVTGGLACLTVAGGSEEKDESSLSDCPALLNCTPVRLMAWQVNDPITNADLIPCNSARSESVVVTTTLSGCVRILEIKSGGTEQCGTWKSRSEDKADLKHSCSSSAEYVDDNQTKFAIHNALFDLTIPGEAPTHIALQPLSEHRGGITTKSSDFSWVRLACGYPQSGLIRIFAPATATLAHQLTHHEGHAITALCYSKCGTMLYSADNTGQLALWQVISPSHLEEKQQSVPPCLIRAVRNQVAVFNVPSFGNSTVESSIISLCPNGERIAYLGPTPTTLSMAGCQTLELLVQVDLDQLDRQCFPSEPDPFITYADSQMSCTPHMIDFACRDLSTGECNLLLVTAGGHMFRLDGKNGAVLACALPEYGFHCDGTEEISNLRSQLWANMKISRPIWSCMRVSPDGLYAVLAYTDKPVICAVSTQLIPFKPKSLLRGSVARTDLVWPSRRFVGHLYPVSSVLFTSDQRYFVSVDRGGDVEKTSAIFIWNFSPGFTVVREDAQSILNGKSSRSEDTEISQRNPAESKGCIFSSHMRYVKSAQYSRLSGNVADKRSAFSEGSPRSLPDSPRSGGLSALSSSSFCRPKSYRHTCLYPSLSDLGIQPLQLSEFLTILETQRRTEFSLLLTSERCTLRGITGFTSQPGVLDNLVWEPDSGLFVYTLGSLLVCENLETGNQTAFTTRPNGRSEMPFVSRGESLTSLALMPNGRALAIGAVRLWSFEPVGTPSSSEQDKQPRCFPVSSIIILPLRSVMAYTHEVEGARFDWKQAERIHYSKIVASHLLKDGINTCPALLSMLFTSNSRYLITVGNCQASIVGLWSTRSWRLLTHVHVDGFMNQLACSQMKPTRFVTVGGRVDEVSGISKCKGQLKFWHIDNQQLVERLLFEETAEHAHVISDEFSSATYLKYPQPVGKIRSTWSSQHEDVSLCELLIISAVSGMLSLWDPNQRIRLFCWSASPVEIGTLVVCGPDTLTSGNASGSLHLWRIQCEQSESKTKEVGDRNGTDIMDNIRRKWGSTRAEELRFQVRLLKEIVDGPDRSPVSVAVFDPEGQMGVVGTFGCNIWYVNWSELEATPSGCSRLGETEFSYGDPSNGLTRLIAGHSSPIVQLLWWNSATSSIDRHPNTVDMRTGQQHTSTTDNDNPLVITCSLDGEVRVWDPFTRELLCQLHPSKYLRDSENLMLKATCMASLNTFGVKCKGVVVGEGSRESAAIDPMPACGCLAVGFSDTSIKVFCIHELRTVCACGPTSPLKLDAATSICFVGPSHLVVGTQQGLLILVTVNTTQMTVLRILRDHCAKGLTDCRILTLDAYTRSVSSQTASVLYKGRHHSGRKPIDNRPSSARTADDVSDLQTNRTTLTDGDLADISGAWIWLAIGNDRRLSVWLLLDRRKPDALHGMQLQFSRCQLLRWVLLDRIDWTYPTNIDCSGQPPSPTPGSFRSNFLSPETGKYILDRISAMGATGVVRISNIPFIVLTKSTGDPGTRVTSVWLYCLMDNLPKQTEIFPWFQLPACAQILTAKFPQSPYTGDSVSTINVFVLARENSMYKVMVGDATRFPRTDQWATIVELPTPAGAHSVDQPTVLIKVADCKSLVDCHVTMAIAWGPCLMTLDDVR